MKYMVYLQRILTILAILFLVCALFFLGYYEATTTDPKTTLTPVGSYITTDSATGAFLETLKQPVQPLVLQPQEFTKKSLFEE